MDEMKIGTNNEGNVFNSLANAVSDNFFNFFNFLNKKRYAYFTSSRQSTRLDQLFSLL